MAQAVSEFQTLLSSLAAELESRIKRLVSTVSNLDQNELLSFVTDAAPELLTPFLSTSGDLTALWYDDQDPTSDFFATPADLEASDDLAATARWAMLQLDPSAAWAGAATRSLFNASRETVKVNAAREGVRWVRHAREGACGFCRLLATRSLEGLSYSAQGVTDKLDAEGNPTGDKTLVVVKSKKDGKGRSPGQEYHDSCNCTAVPLRNGTYQAPSYVEQWKRDYEAARKIAGGKTGSIANAMDYLPGGRRYKGDGAPAYEPRLKPVNLDEPKPKTETPPQEPVQTETDAQIAKRLLPGLEKSLADLRAQGLPENSPQIQYHLTAIARLRRQLQPR